VAQEGESIVPEGARMAFDITSRILESPEPRPLTIREKRPRSDEKKEGEERPAKRLPRRAR